MPKEIWISANVAAEIISANSGRPIIPQYIRDLAQKGKIASKPADGRTNLYLRSDVEKIRVRAHGKKPSVADRPTQIALPMAVESNSPPVEEKPIPARVEPTNVPTSIVERSVDIPSDLPLGTMKRGDFIAAHKIAPNDFQKMRNAGVVEVIVGKTDKNVPVHYLTPEQQEQALAHLRAKGKIADSYDLS